MGRSIPAGDTPFTNRALSYSFFVAWIAATFAIIVAMCGVGFLRRKPTPPPSHDGSNKKRAEETGQAPINTTAPMTPSSPEAAVVLDTEDATTPKPGTVSQELPLPPGMKLFKESHSYNNPSKSTSTGKKIKTSLSMKMPSIRMPSMSMSRREDGSWAGKSGQQFKREDSIWTKTIILGEKCQVPDEDEDDGIIYDHKGKRISTYHPKNQRSLPVSRSNSFIDRDAIPKKL
ncbi:hypothetical protein CDL15_Pgr022121 [Punica granatum]|uniref:Uncharacterized protein n=1 Tax=Punica granatum TaxID=22663 RepID=A0A218VSP0_PUNGR|nr:hypothetical protein CDL15_Pgr022121 [Punica granatum]PKI70644.1 hypothetical protein CRG98_008877 [Punica granatum]